MAIVVDDFGEAENAGPVENEGNNDGSVPALDGVTIVHEGLVAKRGNRETFLLESRKNPGDEELEEEIARVHLPCIEVGTSVL